MARRRHGGRRSPPDRPSRARHAAPPRRCTSFDAESPLSVGNGEFAFTMDVTGSRHSPRRTSRQFRWPHCRSGAGTPGRIRTASASNVRTSRRSTATAGQVGYADIPGERTRAEIQWLRANPHRLHLGRIGFALTRSDGSAGGSGGPDRHPADAGPLEWRHHQPLPLDGRTGGCADALPSHDSTRWPSASSRRCSPRGA